MRTFLFRAWDKKLKQMFEFELMWASYIDGWQLPYPTLVGIGSNWVENENHFTDLMQSIGARDINYKDIYEGDLVKFNHREGYSEVFEVVYLDEDNEHEYPTTPRICSYFLFNRKTKNWMDFQWDDTDDMEVIGNIYEHPHLLESEK